MMTYDPNADQWTWQLVTTEGEIWGDYPNAEEAWSALADLENMSPASAQGASFMVRDIATGREYTPKPVEPEDVWELELERFESR